MNEFLRSFIMKTIRKMVNNVPEWQVREYAIGWYSKGVLTEADLQEIEDIYAPTMTNPVTDDTDDRVEENEPSESEEE